jgi:ribonuclease Z
MSIRLTILGTGSPIPDANRAGSAALIEAGDRRILVDAGRGVLMRLVAAGVLPGMLDAVLLTHLHSDHITDLNDVITTHWVMSQAPTTLHIYGPPRTQEVVDGIMAMLAPDLSYRLAHHEDLTWTPMIEVHELTPPTTLTFGDLVVRVGATDHRPVEPTVGYRFEHGSTAVALAGDSIPCAGLDELCAGAAAYVQTVIREDLVGLVPSQRFKDILDYHSSIEQAAQTAERCGVERLVCTHYVPALMAGQEEEWRSRAAAHFSGEIVLASDLTVLNLGS